MSYSGAIQYDTSGTVRMGQGQPAVYNAIVAAISQALGYIGDQVLVLPGQPESLLQSELRLKTADAPILDIAIKDFFGDGLPRLPNESNASYLNRAISLLFQPKNTRPAIYNMLTMLTGQGPHLINPDVPGDVGGLTATKDNVGALVGGVMVFAHGLWSTTTGALAPPSYLGVDVGGAPCRFANPNGRGTTTSLGPSPPANSAVNPTGNNFGFGWQGLIDTTWPENFGAQGNPVAGFMTVLDSLPPDEYGATGTLGTPSIYTNISGGNGFCACSNPQANSEGQAIYATVNAGLTGSEGFPDLGPSIAIFNPRGLTPPDLANGQAAVLSAINRLRPEGITLWARCLPAQYLAAEGFTT